MGRLVRVLSRVGEPSPNDADAYGTEGDPRIQTWVNMAPIGCSLAPARETED